MVLLTHKENNSLNVEGKPQSVKLSKLGADIGLSTGT